MSFKKNIYIFIIIFLLILLICYDFTLLYVIVFLFFHELSHIITATYLGYTYDKLNILPFGISLNLKQEFIKPTDDFIISISGPLINFVFFVLFSLLNTKFPEKFSFVRLVNLALFLFNIIPAGFLDGGRIFKVILSSYLNFRWSYILTSINGIILGCMIILLSVYVNMSIKALILLMLGLFVIYSSLKDIKKLSMYVIKNIIYKENYIYGKKSFIIKQRAFNGDVKILQILKSLCFNKYYIFYIINKDSNTQKCFELDIIKAYYNYGNITFKECISNIKKQEE